MFNLSFLNISLPKEAFKLFENSQGRACLPLYIIFLNRCNFLGFYKFKPSQISNFFNIKDNKTLHNWLSHLKSLNLINYEYSASTKTYRVTIDGVTGLYPDFSDPIIQAKLKKQAQHNNQPNSPAQPPYPKKSKKTKDAPEETFFTIAESELMEELEMRYKGMYIRGGGVNYLFDSIKFDSKSKEFIISFSDGTNIVTSKIYRPNFKHNHCEHELNRIDRLMKDYVDFKNKESNAPTRSVADLIQKSLTKSNQLQEELENEQKRLH